MSRGSCRARCSHLLGPPKTRRVERRRTPEEREAAGSMRATHAEIFADRTKLNCSRRTKKTVGDNRKKERRRTAAHQPANEAVWWATPRNPPPNGKRPEKVPLLRKSFPLFLGEKKRKKNHSSFFVSNVASSLRIRMLLALPLSHLVTNTKKEKFPIISSTFCNYATDVIEQPALANCRNREFRADGQLAHFHFFALGSSVCAHTTLFYSDTFTARSKKHDRIAECKSAPTRTARRS